MDAEDKLKSVSECTITIHRCQHLGEVFNKMKDFAFSSTKSSLGGLAKLLYRFLLTRTIFVAFNTCDLVTRIGDSNIRCLFHFFVPKWGREDRRHLCFSLCFEDSILKHLKIFYRTIASYRTPCS